MKAPVRRKTARERDRELIAGVGRFDHTGYPEFRLIDDGMCVRATRLLLIEEIDAVCRELNRIAKEARRAR